MNGKNILLVLLVLIVAGGLVVGGFFLGREFSDKKSEECVTEKEEVNEEILTYEMLKGTWTYSKEVKDEDYGDYTISYIYIFESDGTVIEHDYSHLAAGGHVGNYIIDNNKIILNLQYSLGSDISVYPMKSHVTRVIELQEDGTLKQVDDEVAGRSYKKTSEEVTEPFARVDEYINYLEQESMAY